MAGGRLGGNANRGGGAPGGNVAATGGGGLRIMSAGRRTLDASEQRQCHLE